MHDLNRVQLIGHLGHNLETKYSATGTEQLPRARASWYVYVTMCGYYS